MTAPALVCDECGFVYDEVLALGIGARLESAVARIERSFAHHPTALTTRPAPGVWSALEYACHLRDVLLAQRERVHLMLVEDEPVLVSIYREQRVVNGRYNESAPPDVLTELAIASRLLARTITPLSADERARTCRADFFNQPPDGVRSVSWLAVHTLHEAVHHAMDVERVVAATRDGYAKRTIERPPNTRQ